MSKKVLILSHVASMIEQFNMPNIKLLQKMGYEVHVACNFIEGNTIDIERIVEFKEQLQEINVKFIQVDFTRSILGAKNHIKAYKQTKKILEENHYEFVHCHSPIGGVIGRLAGHNTKTKVVYTAHGFHFFTGAPLLNWLVYYPIELLCARFTDLLITINEEDYERAVKKFRARKTIYVPGVGIDIKKFHTKNINIEQVREELGVQKNEMMLLSVGELSKRKNQELVIKALAELKFLQFKYFICGQGAYEERYCKLIKELELEGKVVMLGYRKDIAKLCQAADMFVFPSLQEGLPVALMEAMACRIPIVCSKIRGNVDLIKEESCLFSPYNVDELVGCLRSKLGTNMEATIEDNYERLLQYDIGSVMDITKKEYESLLSES